MTARIVGVDVGGTFTDLIYLEPGESGGTVQLAKVPTTPENQAHGFLAALEHVGIALDGVDTISHGTTTTTNAILERKLSRCGLITTRGFRDVLELGRRTRPTPYGLTGSFEPLIPRHLRLEVPERLDATGVVLTSLDENAVIDAARTLKAAGCVSVVIHFLHSYANPDHERRAADIVRDVWPEVYVTMGHAIVPEFREYERGTAAVINGSVQPILHRYISTLQTELAMRGYERELLMMQGNGGSVAASLATEYPIHTVLSGPASGVMAAAAVARACDLSHVVTFDTGGTSSDVGVVLNGVPQVTSEIELAHGLPVHLPMVDVHAIGAGGGSLIQVNESGLIGVGPESAGADPGPVCFGRGGVRPTLTDAQVLLGRLDADTLLGVGAPVSRGDVVTAVERHVGLPLGLDAEIAAAGALEVATHLMAGAIRMVTLARGHDPRDFALFAFGGGGPMFACSLARELGIPTVLIPPRPGITNAIGCAAADLRHDYTTVINAPLADVSLDLVHRALADHRGEGDRTLAREAVDIETVDYLHVADLQFQGQTHVLSISLTGSTPTREAISEAFVAAYHARFAVDVPEIRSVLVNLRTSVIGRRPPVALELLNPGLQRDPDEKLQKKTRPVWFTGKWWETPILDRLGLAAGTILDGPAIVEQLDATTVIDPASRFEVDSLGNLIIQVTV
jgi:N-methylhydantoinase A